MSDTVAVCPVCDDSSIVHTSQSSMASDAERYRCTACGESFADPEERERRSNTNSVKGLAKRLADTDPDDVV